MRNESYKFFGFVLGFLLVGVLEYTAILFLGDMLHSKIVPRGVVWIVLPSLAGLWFRKAAPELAGRFPDGSIQKAFWNLAPGLRFVAVASGLWMSAVLAYVFLFEPYGDMYSEDYIHMFKVMLFPSLLLAASYFAYVKLVQGKSSVPNEN